MSLNLAECVELSANISPDKTAISFEGTELSYAALAGLIRRMANVFRDKGIGRGDRVALMLPNTPHFPIAYHGVLYAGATVVPLNPLLKPAELAYQLQNCGAKALVFWRDVMPDVVAGVELAGTAPQLIVVEPGMVPDTPETGESFAALVGQASASCPLARTQPEDTAVILYTAATGGWPRGAELTHFNLFQNAQSITQRVLHYNPEDVCLSVLPFFHSFGQTTMMNAAFLSQSKIIPMPRFDVGKAFEIVATEGVTLLAMVPTMFQLALQYRQEETFDLSSLRAWVSGGAKLPQALSAAITARFGITLLEGYGLTETSPVVAFNSSVATNRAGTVGRPIWGCQVRIERPDGSEAETGETGEILVSGHNVMKGYLNDPDATVETIHDGWLHTGDLGFLDVEGYLTLTGLKKDMIIRAGLNVYPREVERILEEHSDVAEAAVVGIADEVRGEEVKAYVVLRNATLSDKDLAAWFRTRATSYKCPRRIEILEKLPRDADGRVQKDILRSGNVPA